MKPTTHQQAILDAASLGKHLAVTARAGSGKTTTAGMFIQSRPDTELILYAPFNKHVADEAKKKFSSLQQCEVGTLHSWCLSVLRKNSSKLPDFQIDTNKARNMVRDEPIQWRNWLAKALQICKQECITQLMLTVSPDKVIACLQDFDAPIPRDCVDNAYNALCAYYESFCGVTSRQKLKGSGETNVIDFDDMIYLVCNTEGLRLPRYKWIIVDEVQDLNLLQIALLKKLITKIPSAKLMLIGDPMQCIYEFRGARYNAFDKLSKDIEAHTLELPVSFRCAKAIIAKAQVYCPDIQAMSDAEPGKLTYLPQNALLANVRNGDVILGRFNAQLIPLLHKLLLAHEQVSYMGKDVLTFMQKVLDRSRKPYSELPEYLDKRVRREESAYVKACLEALKVLALECQTKNALDNALERMLACPQDKGIILSTIHRFKGKEAKRVYVLPWKADNDAETRCKYVAVTRAQEHLVMVTAN